MRSTQQIPAAHTRASTTADVLYEVKCKAGALQEVQRWQGLGGARRPAQVHGPQEIGPTFLIWHPSKKLAKLNPTLSAPARALILVRRRRKYWKKLAWKKLASQA